MLKPQPSLMLRVRCCRCNAAINDCIPDRAGWFRALRELTFYRPDNARLIMHVGFRYIANHWFRTGMAEPDGSKARVPYHIVAIFSITLDKLAGVGRVWTA